MQDVLKKSRLRLLKMHFESGVGHIGGNLSALDVLLTLHHRVMRRDDRFILSKGHAAGALYVTQWSLGRLTEEQLTTFHSDHTKLGGHPVPGGVADALSIGSLGHGLGLAAGVALANKLTCQPGRVFCLLSDGEWNEGSTWESLGFLVHHRLLQLVPIVDLNGLQGFGTTTEVFDLGPLSRKLVEFGMEVREADGHDPEALTRALQVAAVERPVAVLARTIKGHGVSFMENQLEWHYRAMTAEQYQIAVAETNCR
jgi:transketolase